MCFLSSLSHCEDSPRFYVLYFPSYTEQCSSLVDRSEFAFWFHNTLAEQAMYISWLSSFAEGLAMKVTEMMYEKVQDPGGAPQAVVIISG